MPSLFRPAVSTSGTFFEVLIAPVLLRKLDVTEELLLLGRGIDCVALLVCRSREAPLVHYAINIVLHMNDRQPLIPNIFGFQTEASHYLPLVMWLDGIRRTIPVDRLT